MKKVMLVFTIILIFLCSSCNFEQIFCEHEYEFVSQVESTCSINGYLVEQCIKCEKIKETKLPLLPHRYGESTTISPDCINEGYTKEICDDCGYSNKHDIKPALGHDLSIVNEIVPATETQDGVNEIHCSRCDYYETKYISSKNYVDLSIIKTEYDKTKDYQCASYDELSSYFNAAILSFDNELICNINFDYSNFDDLFNNLMDDCPLDFDIYVSASRLGKKHTFSFTYYCIPTKATENVVYTQYGSMNYRIIEAKRTSNFDDFKINNSPYSYKVSNSEQLSYALELGVKPICDSGSDIEKLYNKMKSVLREIITDDMTDMEKALAIHDYIIMNVVYDNELLSAVSLGGNISNYNGFYLEGVFNDSKAVCDGISKAYASLCNIEGIPCVRVTGRSASNPNGPGHAWNKIYIDGNWYIVDATSDGLIINEEFEILTYEHFLISEENYKLGYTPDNYQNIVCSETDYNVFGSMEFSYKNEEYDYIIDSKKELYALVGYFTSNTSKNISIQFKLNFDCGESFKDELKEAFLACDSSATYSYRNSGAIVTILK